MVINCSQNTITIINVNEKFIHWSTMLSESKVRCAFKWVYFDNAKLKAFLYLISASQLVFKSAALNVSLTATMKSFQGV